VSTTRRRIPQPPAAVYELLADGWRYADWVVGAKRIRAVDPTWPKPGSQFHHTLGMGPLTLRDATEMVAYDPGGPVVLKARGWPAGAARVTITAEPLPDGGSEVTMDEEPIEGPAVRLRNPGLDALLHLRNVESLRRLEAALRSKAGEGA
jgi:hypothetical protein